MGGSVPAASQSCRQSGASAGLSAGKGWIKEISMDSAKDSGREMLAAINVEGSGFWLLFISQSVNINIPGYLLVTKLGGVSDISICT